MKARRLAKLGVLLAELREDIPLANRDLHDAIDAVRLHAYRELRLDITAEIRRLNEWRVAEKSLRDELLDDTPRAGDFGPPSDDSGRIDEPGGDV